MNKIQFVVILILIFCVNASAQSPAVFSLNAKALESNKSRIRMKDKLIMPSYRQLLMDADKALAFKPVSVMEKKNDPPSGDKHDYMSLAPYFWPDPAMPNGIPYMRKDGETNPEVRDYKDKDYMPQLCEVLHTLGLAYYFSGENKYAAHAAKLMEVWFLDKATHMNPNLNFSQAIKGKNDGRGAGMIDSRHFTKVTDAIGLIKDSKSWTKTDQDGMVQWFGDFLNWMQTSKNGTDEMNAKNNHGDWYDAQRLSFALFTGKSELAKKIVLNAESRLDKQMDESGMFPLEMERTTSLHYSGFAIQAFFIIAQEAEHTGVDFWNYVSTSGKSLKRAFDIYYPYIAKEKLWTGPQIKPFDFEEGIPLMIAAAEKFNCKTCIESAKNIAGEKLNSLRIKLLTNLEF